MRNTTSSSLAEPITTLQPPGTAVFHVGRVTGNVVKLMHHMLKHSQE